jgi:predicted nucleic acid-binding Zn ribbon protein
MPTYLYETIVANGAPRRFEVRQGIDEAPLAVDPETGEAVRRVISGGLGIVTRGEKATSPASPSCGPATCRCGKFET